MSMKEERHMLQVTKSTNESARREAEMQSRILPHLLPCPIRGENIEKELSVVVIEGVPTNR